MKQAFVMPIFCLVFPLLAISAFAQNAKEEGKRLGRDLKGTIIQATKTPLNADTVPGYQTDRPGERNYYNNPGAMGTNAATASDPAAQTLRNSMAFRPDVGPDAVKAFLGTGFEAQDNPDAWVSGFSGAYGDCHQAPAGNGPDTYYIRTCNDGFTVDNKPESCPITLEHSFDETYGYKCRAEGSFGTLPVCNFPAFSDCELVDINFQCLFYPFSFCLYGGFLLEVTYECKSRVAGFQPSYTRATYLGSKRVTTACKALASDKDCQRKNTVCIEGRQTRRIKGVDITRNCWKWRRNYDCLHLKPASDCAPAKNDPACRFDHRDCLSRLEDGSCSAWENYYRCRVPEGPSGEIAVSCGDDVYCLDGSCDSIKREANTSFPEAATALQMLAQQPGEFDKADYSIFDGERLTCPKTLFGAVNCCTNDGLFVDIGLVGCSGEAKALAKKQSEGLCHYVGTYCSSKVFGVCVKKRKSYCCFKGKLSRIIMEQGRHQLGIGWGSAKNPNCQGLTVQQFQRLDFARMDLREFYADSQAGTNLRGETRVIDDMKARIEAYYDQ